MVAELFSNGAWSDVKEPLYDAKVCVLCVCVCVCVCTWVYVCMGGVGMGLGVAKVQCFIHLGAFEEHL